jgi:hypothetical protein
MTALDGVGHPLVAGYRELDGIAGARQVDRVVSKRRRSQ